MSWARSLLPAPCDQFRQDHSHSDPYPVSGPMCSVANLKGSALWTNDHCIVPASTVKSNCTNVPGKTVLYLSVALIRGAGRLNEAGTRQTNRSHLDEHACQGISWYTSKEGPAVCVAYRTAGNPRDELLPEERRMLNKENHATYPPS